MQPERLTVRLRASQRLDRYLTGRLAQVSRSRIQRHIARGDVLVDGRVVRANHRLHGGEIVTLPALLQRGLEVASVAAEFHLVYEDEDLVVVDKPAGMLMHPVGGEFRHTLLNGLFHRLQSRGEPAAELGIVHRLDRATSGLVVVAKTLASRRQLAAQVEARRMRRLYLAVVHGVPREVAGRIDLPIRRDPRRPTRMQALLPEAAAAALRRAVVPPVSASGYSDPRRDFRPRAARTRYRLLRRLGESSLLRLELDTGRTHQIRVHLQAQGMPLWGDPLYGGVPDGGGVSRAAPAGEKAAREPLGLGRPALHAARLEFTQPRHGTPLRFTAPLPPDLRALVFTLAGVPAADGVFGCDHAPRTRR